MWYTPGAYEHRTEEETVGYDRRSSLLKIVDPGHLKLFKGLQRDFASRPACTFFDGMNYAALQRRIGLMNRTSRTRASARYLLGRNASRVPA